MNLYFYSKEKELTLGGDGKPLLLLMETVPQDIAHLIPSSGWQPREQLYEHTIDTTTLPLRLRWSLVTVDDYALKNGKLVSTPTLSDGVRSTLVTSIKKNVPTLADALIKLKEEKTFDTELRTSRLPHVILHDIDHPITVYRHQYRILE